MKSRCTGTGVITEYEPGDRVRIRRDLKEGLDCPFGVNSDMEKFAGRVVTIKSAETVIGLRTGTHDLYNIYEDSGIHSWSQEMLEPVFAAGGIVPQDAPRNVVTLGEMIETHPMTPCGTISLTLSKERKNKSGIESRKDIRKRLLRL